MKRLIPWVAIAIAAAAVAAGTSSQDGFARVKGQFSGPGTFEFVGEQPDSGTFGSQVRTSKSGTKMRFHVSGVADPSDTPVPVDATVILNSKKKTVTSSSFLMGYYGPMNTARARLKEKRRTFTFTLKSGAGSASIQGTPIDGSVTYQCKFNRRALSIAGSGFVRVLPAGPTVPYVMSLSGTRVK